MLLPRLPLVVLLLLLISPFLAGWWVLPQLYTTSSSWVFFYDRENLEYTGTSNSDDVVFETRHVQFGGNDRWHQNSIPTPFLTIEYSTSDFQKDESSSVGPSKASFSISVV
jgi:hypothetical protein